MPGFARKNSDLFSLASHALRACKARALRARNTLAPHFPDFFTDFEKKTRLFCTLLFYYQTFFET